MTGAVNIQTGKIVGVEEGTLAYYHELGHIEYNNSEKGINNSIKKQWIFDFVIVSLIASFLWRYFFVMAGMLFILYKGYDLYEERWCWKYAKEKMNGN